MCNLNIYTPIPFHLIPQTCPVPITHAILCQAGDAALDQPRGQMNLSTVSRPHLLLMGGKKRGNAGQ